MNRPDTGQGEDLLPPNGQLPSHISRVRVAGDDCSRSEQFEHGTQMERQVGGVSVVSFSHRTGGGRDLRVPLDLAGRPLLPRTGGALPRPRTTAPGSTATP